MPRYKNELKLETDGTEDFRVAIRELRRANRDLPNEFLKSVREVARGVRDLAKVRALEEPSRGVGHTGLRASVSRGVKIINIDNGIRILTEARERDEAIIPRGMDNDKGWRHPVFGNRNNWVRQRSGENSWFMDSMQQAERPLTLRLVRNLNDAADRIGNAT